MKIMVFNVPAETSGALSVLHDFYNDVCAADNLDTQWCFVLGKATLPETENVTILRLPWIKKSWLHRLYFDQIVAPNLVRKYKPDMILSLQNVVVPHTRVFQVLYVHQPLPFVDYKFKIHENFYFWIYQNIIGRIIFHSIKKAHRIIVQTHWMKKACIEKIGVDKVKIEVIPPKISIKPKAFFKPTKGTLSTFFYPATPLSYKNHTVILDACQTLLEHGIVDFRVVFTLRGDENEYSQTLFKRSKKENLPIDFVGSLAREEVFDFYTRSILLFPSYIETFGLPMLEAQMHKTIIFASDCVFSHEILDGYENVYFFNPFNIKCVSDLIQQLVTSKITYTKPALIPKSNDLTLLSKILEYGCL